MDIASKYAAENFPYQHVEDVLGNVPEPIQKRIVYWAFPRDEKAILLYSSTKVYSLANEQAKQPFQAGKKIVDQDGVSGVMQIGKFLINLLIYIYY